MDLCYNEDVRFTRWALQNGLLREKLVVFDVGVLGGEHPRWLAFGDHVEVHGFDPIREVIDELVPGARAHRHYHWMAAGAEDGEVDLFFNEANPSSSSLQQHPVNRYIALGERRDRTRRVPVRRLDGLVASGGLPSPDFIKIDVEGREPQVLQGAAGLLASSLLACEAETNLGASAELRRTHFGELLAIATHHGLRAFDLAFNRVPTTSFQLAVEADGRPRVLDQRSVGKVMTLNVLFSRDPVAERDEPGAYEQERTPLSVQQTLKLMMLLESHGLNDVALDIARRFQSELAALFDVEQAVRLLANADCRLNEPIVRMEKSLSWRITAPLRAGNRWRRALMARWRPRS